MQKLRRFQLSIINPCLPQRDVQLWICALCDLVLNNYFTVRLLFEVIVPALFLGGDDRFKGPDMETVSS